MGHSGAKFSIAWSTWLWFSEFEDVRRRAPRQAPSPVQVFLEAVRTATHLRVGFRKAVVGLSSQILYRLLVSLMEDGGVMHWKEEHFAGVYWGYDISEMKTARVNVLHPFPAPFPRIDVFIQKKKKEKKVSFLLSPCVPKSWISDNSVLSAFLNGDKPTS